MPHVFLDFETYSECDLARAGPDVYARHSSTRVLMLAWAVDPPRDLSEDGVRQWFPHEGPMSQELRELLEDDAVILEAHNASFERLIFRHVLGMDIPIERWRDTMVRCFYAGLPGQLGKAAEVLGLPHDKAKDRRGKALIRRFCQPGSLGKSDVGLIPEDDEPWPEAVRRAYPQEWEEFCRYNRQDVVAEVAVAYALSPVRVPQELWDEWFIDQRINDAGVPIRRPLVVNAVRVHEEERARLLRRLSEITGVANPRSRAQLLKWLRANGYVRPDLTTASVRMALAEDDLSPEVREVLQLRQRASLTSGDKYATILDGLADDDHMRHVLQFHGAARTGRWSGRRWQPHNLARPPSSYCPEPAERGQKVYKAMADILENSDLPWLRMIDDVPTLLKGLSRAVMQAPPGKMFCDCDLSAIENITLGWLAGEEKILRVFREGRDPYIDFATYMFGQSYDEIWHEVKVQKKGFKRKIAKPATLGCLGRGTLVLTKRGWVPIERVTVDDRVWNGVCWARHNGVVSRGIREVVCWDGVFLTTDHEVFDGREWTTWREEFFPCLRSARSMVFSRSCLLSGHGRQQGKYISSGVGSVGACLRIGGQGLLAIKGKIVERGVSTSFRRIRKKYRKTTISYSRIGITRSKQDVLMRSLKDTRITEAGGLRTSSRTWIRSCVSVGRMGSGQSTKSIGSITTAPTLRGIYAQRRGRKTRRTHVARTESTMPGRSCVRRSSVGVLPRGIAMRGRLRASCELGRHQSKLSRSRRIAAARITYDVIDVEGTSAFVVLADSGPMLVHNCGYMLGPGKIVIDEKTGLETATGLIGYARDMGIDMTPEQAQHAVQVFRDTYQRVRALWYEGYEALCATVLDGKPRVYGGKVRLEMAGQWLRAILPSGRAIHYYRPRVKMRETPWGEIKPQFEYEGKRPNGSWGVVSSHPGKCVENFVQAIARDILMLGIRRAHEAGLDVRLHVHDQIVVLADEERAQETLEKLRAFMTAEIPWARDMPLKAGGFTTPIFMKD